MATTSSSEQRVVKTIPLKTADQPIQKVTVFNDRAEIVREAEVQLEAGLNEILFQNLSQNLAQDSVRVEGTGASALIHEVAIQEKPTRQDERDSAKVAEFRAALERAEVANKIAIDANDRLKRKIALFDKFIESAAQGQHNKEKESLNFAEFTNALHSYDKETAECRQQMFDTEKQVTSTQEEVERARRELQQHEYQHGVQDTRSISVLIESSAQAKVQLSLQYHVYGASWYPRYDIRVDSQQDKKQPSMTIIYSGILSQSTGEEWKDVPLVLSTGRPAVSGQLPTLPDLKVGFYRPPPPPVAQSAVLFGAAGGSNTASFARAVPKMMKAAPVALEMAAPMAYASATVVEASEHSLTTEFAIARPATIPSDRTEHKVAIGQLTLQPTLVRESAPLQQAVVFLAALASNKSAMQLLPGEASVYFNNSFVAKTRLENVAPGEPVRISLGVDPAVRLETKPKHTYHEQTGLLSKASVEVSEHRLVVHNTRSSERVLLTLRQAIPRSQDEKIKVRVTSPPEVVTENGGDVESAERQARAPSPGARLNGQHHLAWTVTLEPSEKKEFLVKYAIEYPGNEKIEVTRAF